MPSSRVLSVLVFVFVTLLSSVLSAPVAIPELADTDSMKRVAPTPATRSGRGTWFYPGENACGSYDNNNSPIVAISAEIFSGGKHCGRWLKITNPQNKKSTKARVSDNCPSCAAGSLDMSPKTFEAVAKGGLNEGEMPIEWFFTD